MPEVPRPYSFAFVRTDLPVADQVVQVGHVCMEAGARWPGVERENLVVFGVDKGQLEYAMDRLAWLGIEWVEFHEPDEARPGEGPMGLTAICTRPSPGQPKALRLLKLWNV